MSHEGIRIVSQAEARGEDTPKLTGDAIRPAKVRVDKSGGTGVVIEWKDGTGVRGTCVAAGGVPLRYVSRRARKRGTDAGQC